MHSCMGKAFNNGRNVLAVSPNPCTKKALSFGNTNKRPAKCTMKLQAGKSSPT